jgi:integrase
MGLYRRPDSKDWWMSFSANGKLYRRSTETADKKLAEKIYGKVQTQITEGKWFDVDEAKLHTFEEMVQKYLMEYCKSHKAESTTQRDERYISLHLTPFLGGLTLDKITPKLINQYKTQRLRVNKLGTVAIDLRILSKMFSLAVKEWEWCKDNPVSKVTIGKLHNEIDRWLTHDEEEKLLNHLPGWLREIVLFALNTGMRQDEILSLKWTEVDLFRRTVTVLKSKNYERRVIPLDVVALNLLSQKAKVRAISGLVFPDPKTGQKIIPENVMWYFYSAQEKAGISHVQFHDLRHTFATRLVQSGCDLYKVSKLLGHRDIKTTQRYAHHYPESLRDGVEVLDVLYAKNKSKESADFTFFSRSTKQVNVNY